MVIYYDLYQILIKMSLRTLIFPKLGWGELFQIVSFLSIRDLWVLGCTNRSAFITFLREKALRKFDGDVYGTKFSRFLSKFSSHEKVCLVSYPRSGNSYLRKLLESMTSIVTGSDSRPNRTLSTSLLQSGYKGEGITDESVWIVKSHYPERYGFIRFQANRVILLVRNPYDTILSYFHMGLTNTHNRILAPSAFHSLRSVWTDFIKNEAEVWRKFYSFWIDKAGQAPTMIVRYEDLLADEKGTLSRIKTFLLEGKPPNGLARFIPIDSAEGGGLHNEGNDTNNAEISAPGYSVKKRKLGKAFETLTAEDVQIISHIVHDTAMLFGYQVNFSDTAGSSNIQRDTEADSHTAVDLCSLSVEPMIVSTSQESTPGTDDGGGRFVVVNDQTSVRSADDRFGRKITELRQSLTQNDSRPFETI